MPVICLILFVSSPPPAPGRRGVPCQGRPLFDIFCPPGQCSRARNSRCSLRYSGPFRLFSIPFPPPPLQHCEHKTSNTATPNVWTMAQQYKIAVPANIALQAQLSTRTIVNSPRQNGESRACGRGVGVEVGRARAWHKKSSV